VVGTAFLMMTAFAMGAVSMWFIVLRAARGHPRIRLD